MGSFTITLHLVGITVESCEADGSFPVLRRVKTRLRATISELGLTGLTMLAVDYTQSPKLNTEDVVRYVVNRHIQGACSATR